MAIPIKVAPSDVIFFILKCSPTHSTENFHFTYALWIEMHDFKSLWMTLTSISTESPHPKIS